MTRLMIALFAKLTWMLMLAMFAMIALSFIVNQLLLLESLTLNLVALGIIALLVRRSIRRRPRAW